MALSLKSNVAILAGGEGSRLRSRNGNMPKALTPILGRSVLEHLIILCRKHGFTNIALLVHYEHEQISSFFGDGAKLGVNITYVIEEHAGGTAGALLKAGPVLDEQILVLYADTYADVDLKKFWDFDPLSNTDGVLFLHPNDHPQDSDIVETRANGLISKIHGYPHANNKTYPNLVNAGIYKLKKDSLLNLIPTGEKSDIAKNIFPRMLKNKRRLRGYISPEYIKDMGTPERLDKVIDDINRGIPEYLSGRAPRTAIFLDRDGTINQEVNYLFEPSQLQLLKGASEAIRQINMSGSLAVCITNQPVLARGEISITGLKKIHNRLDQLLGHGGAYLDRIYFCPHHPDNGFPGEIKSLKTICECRKPETGLIDFAVKELNISRRNSWMIGDTTSDILAGKRAGLKTILLRTGYAGRDYKYPVEPNFIAADLKSAIDWIQYKHAFVTAKLLPIVGKLSNQTKIILIGGASRAGKSTVAQVLKEILNTINISAHILAMDCWLKPLDKRIEGAGVQSRYDLNSLIDILEKFTAEVNRMDLKVPQFDRKTGAARPPTSISIGSKDILIIEGVPALLNKKIRDFSNLKIYTEIDEQTRRQRLIDEYKWRNMSTDQINTKINSREIDEVQKVMETKIFADHILSLGNIE